MADQKKKEKALQVFQTLDTDGDGILTPEELAEIVEPEDLDGVMAKLDLDDDGHVNFDEFYKGFDAFLGGDEEDEGDEDLEEDEDGNPTLHGAPLNMVAVHSKIDARGRQFSQGFAVVGDGGESDGDEQEDSTEASRVARFKKILTWMNDSAQMIGIQEVEQTITFLCRRAFNTEEHQIIKDMFLKQGFVTIKSSVVASVITDTETAEKKKANEDQWDNDRFISIFLANLEKGIQLKSAGKKDTSKEEQIASLTQINQQMSGKITRLTQEVKKHKKNASKLDDEVTDLRGRLGDGADGRKNAEQVEKERQEQLESYESMMSQLRGDKQQLERDLKNLQQECQNDRALLKVKQTMIKNSSSELKSLRERMKGLLQTHSEQNKLELKKKVGKMTAIMARRRLMRELQIDNERIPQLEVDNLRLKHTVSKLQAEAQEYMRIMDSYSENRPNPGEGLNQPSSGSSVNVDIIVGDEEELEELRRRLREEKETTKMLKEKLNDTMNLLEEEKQAREAAEEKVQELTTQCEALTEQVEGLTAKMTQLETDLAAEKLARQREKEEFETKIADLEERIRALEKQLEEEIQARKALEAQLSELGDDSQTKIADMVKEIAELKRRIKELESELESEKSQREALEEKLTRVQAELEDEMKKRKELEEELAQAKTDLEEAQNRVAELEEILSKMETEVVTIIEAKVFVEAVVQEIETGLVLNSDQQAELSAYARCFNLKLGGDPDLEYLLPLHENNSDLLYKLKDGLLIAKFINKCVPDTIDERALNLPEGGKLNSEQILENLTLCLGSAKAIGIPIADDEKLLHELLNPGEPDVLLEFIFGLVKTLHFQNISVSACPELVDICENPETGLSGLKLKELETDALRSLNPDKLLMRWLNWHMIAEAEGHLEGLCKDWGDDLADATAYSYVLAKIAECKGDGSAMPDRSKTDGKRARHVLDKATYLKVEHFHIASNITGGNDRLNMLFTACIFNSHSGIEDEEELSSGARGNAKKDARGTAGQDLTDEMREERAYRMWINSCGIPKCFVNNLFLDCRDGLTMLKLIDHIKPGTVDWKRVSKKPKGKFNKVANGNLVVKYLKGPLKLKIQMIGGTDIADGHPNFIMSIMSQLMRYDTMQKLEKAFKKMGLSGGKNEEKAIIRWCNEKVAAKRHDLNPVAKMRSFRDKSLNDSLFFFNLIWTIQPRLIKWKMVNTECSNQQEKTRNAGYVISVARKLGAEVYLLPHDIVESKPKQIMLFIGSIMASCHN